MAFVVLTMPACCNPRPANLIRRVRRMKLLSVGEAVERILVSLAMGHSGWIVTAKPDPVRGSRNRRARR